MCYVMLSIGVFERGNDRIEWGEMMVLNGIDGKSIENRLGIAIQEEIE